MLLIFFMIIILTSEYRINYKNINELINKESELYNPKLYEQLVKEIEERKIKNLKIKKIIKK